jgi:uncharacterized protein YndB with AHSA1/START domain
MSHPRQAADIAAWLAATQRRVRGGAKSRAAVLQRRFEAPVDAVWRAWTDRERLGVWFGSVSGDLRQGATLRLEVGAPHPVTCVVERCEPPRRLSVTWWYEGFAPDYVDHVELRLTAVGGSTELELEHRSENATDFWNGVGPGWEDWLFRLTALLLGANPPELSDELQAQSAKLWVTVIPEVDMAPRAGSDSGASAS